MTQYIILPQSNESIVDGIRYSISLSTNPKFNNVHAVVIDEHGVDIEFCDNTPNDTTMSINVFVDVINEIEQIRNTPAVVIEKTIDELKKDKEYEIKQAAFDALDLGCISHNIKMNTTIFDIQQLITMYEFNLKMGNKTMDLVDFDNNVQVGVEMGIVDDMILELEKNYQAIFDKKQKLRAAIKSATTTIELNNIVW